MPELIDKDALRYIESAKDAYTEDWNDDYERGFCDAINKALELPTIEPEVQHACWEPNEIGEYYCTHCGVECDVDKFHKALLNPFCGSCGAKMDGGADNG